MFVSEIRMRRIEGVKSSRWHWHLGEMFVKIKRGATLSLAGRRSRRRSLGTLRTKMRDKKAALKFLKKTMRKNGRPEVIVTDGLASYDAALKEIGAADRQETGRSFNNCAENSHLPFRRRERAMLCFRQMRSLQKFAAVHASVYNHFNQERSL